MLLSVQHINKKYKNEDVLRNISLSLEANHTLSILGKSGCGKTTLLKIIAGIELQDSGSIVLNDININLLPPNKRTIVYMSQEPLLFPHLNVFENIAFGLRIRKEEHSTIKKKVTKLIDELGLTAHHSKMPDQLSGGQKQRVNFGRSLIINPPLILLDEPFGNLDTQTRTEMQGLFKQITSQFSISSIFVTHDIKEALIMADSIGYMKDGNLQTYDNKNSFIADNNTGVQQEIDFWKKL
jgi:ABC-type Fe3+/spermidine/putrescine transport system ATPase subunit